MKEKLINDIKIYLQGRTGINFHKKIVEVLKVKYPQNSSAPKQPGGDGGVDFVKNITNEYFAIDGESKSSSESYKKKFQSDVKKMYQNIGGNGQWTGKIEGIYFLMQTFDEEMPNFFQGRYSDEIVKLMNDIHTSTFPNERLKVIESGNSYTFQVINQNNDCIGTLNLYFWNVATIANELEELSVEELQRIKKNIGMINIESFSDSKDLFEGVVGILNSYIQVNSFFKISYERKSTDEKLDDLPEIREEIEMSIQKMNWAVAFDDWLKTYRNQKKFTDFVNYVKKVFKELEKKYSGSNLFQEIVIRIADDINEMNDKYVFSIVSYIFDRCDIF